MNIVIVGSAYPLRGGIAAFVERMAAVLTDAGHNVVIYSYSLQYPGFLFPGKSQYSNEPPDKTLHIETKINTVNPLNWLKVGNELRTMKPDLILVKYWMPFFAPSLGTIFRRVRKNGHTKIVAILDNVLPHEKMAGDAALGKYFLNSIDGAISMSKSVTEDLVRLAPLLPYTYSPHPVYDNFGTGIEKTAARRELGLDLTGRYILFFGFIRKYKGLDLLMEAMANKEVRASGIRLIIAGEYYGDEDYYQNLINQLDIGEQLLLYTDFIPNERVKYFFCSCDLVVQPYKTATQSGISQIAYYFNKPMIVTNVGGLPEIVPDGQAGYVVDPSADAIAKAIIKAFEGSAMSRFEEKIKSIKKKYEWSTFIEAIFMLYNKMRK